MPRLSSVSLAASLAAAVVFLGACSNDAGGGYVPPDPYGTAGARPGAAPGGAADPNPAPDDAPSGDRVALVATEAEDLGTIVTDADGYTLYRFDEDSADPAEATCVDACAEKWPPVIVGDVGTLTLDGVETSAVGKVERPDGDLQLTIEGWPVYRYAADADAGSTEGQGVGGTWYAVTPEGKKAALAP